MLDNEGVDFSYYFSARYLNKHDKSQPARGRGRGDRGGRGGAAAETGRGGRGGDDRGGRGRGRGDRGGRGRGRGGADAGAEDRTEGESEETKYFNPPGEAKQVFEKPTAGNAGEFLDGRQPNEQKLATIYEFLHKYLLVSYKAGKFVD